MLDMVAVLRVAGVSDHVVLSVVHHADHIVISLALIWEPSE